MKRFWIALVLTLVPTLAAAQETTVLPLVTGGPAPVHFEARRSDVYTVGGGYMAQGDVALVTALGRLTLAQSRLFFDVNPQTGQIVRVRGEAFVPSPFEGPYVSIKKPAMAEFGMDFGRNIALGVPLQDDRTYFYFRFDAGFEMQLGVTGDAADPKPITLAIPAGVNALLLVDPLDPFFYFSGGIVTPESDDEEESDDTDPDDDADPDDEPPPVEPPANEPPDEEPETGGGQTGFGMSSQALIPFRPGTTYGIAQNVREFNGNRIYTGTFPIGTLPVEATGLLISDVRVAGSEERAVDPLGIGLGPSVEMGVNGTFEFTYSFLKVAKLGKIASFGFELGQATAAVQVVNGVQHMYFSGIISPDTSWLPDFVPFKPEGEIKAYGYMSSAATDFVLHTDGRFAVDASGFGRLVGVNVGDILAVEGSLHVDRNGMRIQGRTDAGLGAFGYDEQRWVDVWVPFNGEPGYLTLGGLNQIANMSVQGQLHVTPSMVEVTGRLDTPAIESTVRAAVTATETGTRLTGEMTVPSQFNTDLSAAIVGEGQRVTSELAVLYDSYQDATANYQFELSLRGMRTLIPGLCDSVVSILNQAQNIAHARIDEQWPWYLPGKDIAKAEVTSQLSAHRARFTTLKSRVQSGDNATVRAALVSAIDAVLANQVVRITVPVIGTVYSRDILTATQEGWLRTARTAVGAIPAASNLMISAQQIWDHAPKREQLVATANAITAGVAGAAPRITRLGFDQAFGLSGLTLLVVVEHQGQSSTIALAFDPVHPEQIGRTIGLSLAGMM